jgi:hypothetical protein
MYRHTGKPRALCKDDLASLCAHSALSIGIGYLRLGK